MEKQFVSLVSTVCGYYKVNPNWVAAIIQKESVWNPWVIRYERHYAYLKTPERFVDRVWNSYDTECQSQKTSWGLGQIMGGLAREQGHTGLLTQLLDANTNLHMMCVRVLTLMKKSDQPPDIFAMYNGGMGALNKSKEDKFPNQPYVDDVLNNLKYFKLV